METNVPDRVDVINMESVMHAPAEGEGFSTGRGGAANVHPPGSPFSKLKGESNAVHSGQMARLGLAYVSL